MERWRWKNSEFRVRQIRAGQPLPPGFVRGEGMFDKSILAYVTIYGQPVPVRDTDWVRYDESDQPTSVMTDARLRLMAVSLED